MTTTEQPQHFPCPQCGAELNWDPSSRTLSCDFCGYQQAVGADERPEDFARPAIKERDLFAFLQESQAQKAHGYGVETKSVKCEKCGATVSVDPKVTSTECPFCGSNLVLEQAPDEALIRPESLIPFQVDRETAVRRYREWLGKGWFHPGDLKKRAGQSRIYGVYLPFWTFDAHASSDWRAEAGYYYYETETYWTTEDGKQVQKTRQVRRTRWEPAWGRHEQFYDDVLIYATQSVEPKLLERIYPFDTSKLVPYDPRYLSGWQAEQYQIGLEEGWKLAEKRIKDKERDACAKQVPGDTYRNLQVSTRLSKVTFKHVLLPVWIASYPYKGKVYRYLVNGQTGKIYGEKPISWIRVAIAVVVVLIILAIVVYFLTRGGGGGSMGWLLLGAV